MQSKKFTSTPEVRTIITLLIASLAALVFMDALVATPKALFGQSLSAIAPSLFPTIVLTLLAGLCVGTLVIVSRAQDDDVGEKETPWDRTEWTRAAIFFGIMLFYSQTMVPFGFLISTALALVMNSLLMGTRSVVQITLVSVLGPVLLYLAATRLLAVSLPELNTIELFYARFF